MKNVTFRFFQYPCESDNYKDEKPKYITGFIADGNYGDLLIMYKNLIGSDVKLRGKWYMIDDVTASYGGDKEDLFCIDIHCI